MNKSSDKSQKDKATSEKISAKDVAVEVGEIMADVLTLGIYGNVSDNLEETAKLKELHKSGKITKKEFDDQEDDADIAMAGEIAANVATLGIYGAVCDGIDLLYSDDEDDEKQRAKKLPKKVKKEDTKSSKKRRSSSF